MKSKLNFDSRLGICFIGIILILTVISFFYTPYNIYSMNIAARFIPPGMGHLLGTDNFGRDVFSRLMCGAKFTLLVADSTVCIGTFFGVILGLCSGYFGGIVDECIMRLIDALNSFPGILLALVMVTVLGKGKYSPTKQTGSPCLLSGFIPPFQEINGIPKNIQRL